jgi:hypothetical protein
VRAELKNKFLKQEPTQKQIESHMPWEEILKCRDALDHGSDSYLLMCLVTMIPPRRQLDWFNIRVYLEDPEPRPDHNYISLGSVAGPYVFLCKYKTWSTYGNYENNIPAELAAVLSGRGSGQLLFKKEYGTVEQWTAWSNRIIKKVLSIPGASMNTLRHSYASYMARTNPNMSLWMRACLARDMGHSLEESLAYDVVRNLNTSVGSDSAITTMDGSEVNHLKSTIKQLQKRIAELESELARGHLR